MNLMYFLDQRLEIIQHFYANANAGFGETKRKIEKGETPYDDFQNPEHSDDPPFLEEWNLADASEMLIGAAALDYLQGTLHAFLQEYMESTGNDAIVEHLKKFQKGSWCENYREAFMQCLEIDWTESRADLKLIEHFILSRNDFAHGSELLTLYAFQNHKHECKHPNGAFVDERWRNSNLFRKKLAVSQEALDNAIGEVRQLCAYLDTQRTPSLPQVSFKS